MNFQEYAKKMLAKPIASQVSAEHEEHAVDSPDYVAPISEVADGYNKCCCDICRIIRIKRHFRVFPRSKCQVCGELFYPTFYATCARCRTSKLDTKE